MEKETKLRTLCILKILYELSDVDHQLSTAEIAEQLEENTGLRFTGLPLILILSSFDSLELISA